MGNQEEITPKSEAHLPQGWQATADEIDLRELVLVLWQQKLLILIITVLFAVCCCWSWLCIARLRTVVYQGSDHSSQAGRFVANAQGCDESRSLGT